MLKKKLLLLLSFFLISPAFAADDFKGEAEAGAILVSANSESESYAFKTSNSYTQGKNIYGASGHYIRTIANGIESSRNWNFGLRFDHELSDEIGFFMSQKIESDVYAGYTQRDSTDIGVKHYILRGQETNWTVEGGFRYSKSQLVNEDNTYNQLLRLYTEVDKDFDKKFSGKYWIEYLPNLSNPDAYQVNTEASLNIMLNSIFSLKLGYLIQYQNHPADDGKYTATTTTMNLVARF